MANERFTPTQIKLLSLLADGKGHTRQEIHALLYDRLDPVSNIRPHLCHLRRQLRSAGQDIRCELLGGVVSYRLVRVAETAGT
jgi:DNA-binding winged helix-turn-helix (wHTH) protein